MWENCCGQECSLFLVWLAITLVLHLIADKEELDLRRIVFFLDPDC